MHGTLSDQSLIYLQIAQMLEDDILRGVYREEEQVPSTNELSRVYHINPATAAKGLNLLSAEGILYKRRGIGMFVAPGAEQAVRAKRKAAFYDSYVRPLVKEGASLAVTGEELLAMVRRAIEEGDAPPQRRGGAGGQGAVQVLWEQAGAGGAGPDHPAGQDLWADRTKRGG